MNHFSSLYWIRWGFPGGAVVKNPTCQCRKHRRLGFDPWVGKIPWSWKWQPAPGFVPGKFQEEPGGLQFMRLQRVGQDWLTEHIDFVTISLLLFMFCFVWPWGMWYLSSLTRTLTLAPCIGRQCLNRWTAREVPPKFLIIILLLKVCINIVENREKKCY